METMVEIEKSIEMAQLKEERSVYESILALRKRPADRTRGSERLCCAIYG